MELWIRSQNRVNLILVKDIVVSGEYIKVYKETELCTTVAKYKTEARALEVLDEIQEAKLGNFHYRCPSNVKVSSKEDTIVYEMPKE